MSRYFKAHPEMVLGNLEITSGPLGPQLVKPNLTASAKERVKGMVELRNCVRRLIDLQMDEYIPDSAIIGQQAELNQLYDSFARKFGLINDRANRLAFSAESAY